MRVFPFLLLLSTTVSAAGIHRWVDDEGRIHFGDRVPAQYQAVEIETGPAPSDESVRDARERVQRLQEPKSAEETGLPEKKRIDEPATTDGPTSPTNLDPDCFSRIEAAWGGRLPNDREGVSRVPLTQAELRRLSALFRSMLGYSRGTVEETICIGPDAAEARETYLYDLRTKVRERSSSLFRIEAELRDSENRSIHRQYLWFLLDGDGLRFRKVPRDVIILIDQPRNDVEMLHLGNNELLFYWRRDGRARRTNLLYLATEGSRWTMREYFYVQGILAEKRFWTIDD